MEITSTPVASGRGDRELRELIEEADLGVLAATLVHLRDDASWVTPAWREVCEAARRPGSQPPDPVQRAALLDEACATIARLERGGLRPVSRPSDEVLLSALELATSARPGPSYLPKLLIDFGLDSDEPAWTPRSEQLERMHVAVVGGGLSGLCMAMRLREAGFPFTVIEKNAAVGGTWLENVYPDCGVDTSAHLYCYTQRPNSEWSRAFAKRDEILDYIQRCTADAGLDQHIMFETEVVSAIFDPAAGHWVLTLQQRDGTTSEMRTPLVVSAVGSLNRPKVPDIPGIEEFEGRAFHTARWPEGFDISGLRVGTIGNGSSGVQVGPRIAERASHLTHFQRSPHWISPNPDAARLHGAGERWLMRELPFYAEWYRFMLYVTGDLTHEVLVRDPGWTGPGINARNEALRATLTEYIRHELADRPDLVEALVPTYPPFGKRMVRDNGWYRALARPNVELVTEPIVRATARGLVTADGRLHELDVIVFATGFHNTRFMWPMEVRGRSGRTPGELAGGDDDLRAYLGVAIPDFPNLFTIVGPNSAFGHGGSSIFIAEAQSDYVIRCLQHMVTEDFDVIECTESACDAYNAEVDAGLEHMVWAEPGLTSRYRNLAGRIVTNHPWTLQEYWLRTRQPDFSAFELSRNARSECDADAKTMADGRS